MRSQSKSWRQYQQDLIDAYYDARRHEILDPLYKAFEQWKRGDIKHNDLTELIHKVHQENQRVYNFFTQSRRQTISCIKLDSDWFTTWLTDNPPPPGMELEAHLPEHNQSSVGLSRGTLHILSRCYL